MESLDFQCVKGSGNAELCHASNSNYPNTNRETHVIALFTSIPGFSEEPVDIVLTLGLHHERSSAAPCLHKTVSNDEESENQSANS